MIILLALFFISIASIFIFPENIILASCLFSIITIFILYVAPYFVLYCINSRKPMENNELEKLRSLLFNASFFLNKKLPTIFVMSGNMFKVLPLCSIFKRRFLVINSDLLEKSTIEQQREIIITSLYQMNEIKGVLFTLNMACYLFIDRVLATLGSLLGRTFYRKYILLIRKVFFESYIEVKLLDKYDRYSLNKYQYVVSEYYNELSTEIGHNIEDSVGTISVIDNGK